MLENSIDHPHSWRLYVFLDPETDSGVGGFEGSVRHQLLPSPPPPLQRKLSPDFYVLHEPHSAAQLANRNEMRVSGSNSYALLFLFLDDSLA